MSSAIDSNSTIESEIFTNGEDNVIKDEKKEEVLFPMDMKNEESIKLEKSEDINGKADISSEQNAQTLIDQSFILEGKRSRKPTLRLEMSESTPTKKEFVIPQGHGKPLGEIEYISYQISHASSDALSRMRNICFGRRGSKATIRKHLREFKGFEFAPNSTEYQKHFNSLIKMKKDELRSISNILGLPLTGRNVDHTERILTFLIKPVDEGRKVPGKKPAARKSKKRSTPSKGSVDTDAEAKEDKRENESDYNFKPGKKSHQTDSKSEVEPSIDQTETPSINPMDETI